MKTYRCYICGLEYDNGEIAKECEEFCKKYGACSLDIAKKSIKKK